MTSVHAIIANSTAHANALKLWAIPLLDGHDLEGDDSKHVLVLDDLDDFRTRINRSSVFVERLLCEACGGSFADVTILVDALNANLMSMTHEVDSIDQTIAALILCFPEVRWLIGRSSAPSAELNEVLTCCGLESIADPQRIPLFDPTGLRECIRWKTNRDLESMAENKDEAFQLPRRRELAAVIEDETDYAMMHGYAAYRFGFRTDVVTTWGLMEDRFHVQSPEKPSADSGKAPATLTIRERHKYRLILEDMRLQFADKKADIHLSSLEERGRRCNRLRDENDDSDFRFMISTGQETAADDLWATNEGYLYNKRVGIGRIFPKPIGGPLELWRATGLNKLLESGRANGFVSPPSEINDELYSGHGAPGKLALVAGKLVERARRVAANAEATSGFILSAVLANDAFELLGGKTPTMALEALKIKHTSEVRAECTFVGAGFHFDVHDRVTEINQFVKATCRWYHPLVRRHAELDARATICNELVKVYSEAGQAEEHDACLAAFRWNNRRLELLQAFERWSPVGIAMNCVLLYAELLLVSMTRIIFAVACWIAIFVALTMWSTGSGLSDFSVLVATQLNWMVGGAANGFSSLQQEVSDADRLLATLSIFANVVGVFHFGILISYFYSLISRK